MSCHHAQTHATIGLGQRQRRRPWESARAREDMCFAESHEPTRPAALLVHSLFSPFQYQSLAYTGTARYISSPASSLSSLMSSSGRGILRNRSRKSRSCASSCTSPCTPTKFTICHNKHTTGTHTHTHTQVLEYVLIRQQCSCFLSRYKNYEFPLVSQLTRSMLTKKHKQARVEFRARRTRQCKNARVFSARCEPTTGR